MGKDRKGVLITAPQYKPGLGEPSRKVLSIRLEKATVNQWGGEEQGEAPVRRNVLVPSQRDMKRLEVFLYKAYHMPDSARYVKASGPGLELTGNFKPNDPRVKKSRIKMPIDSVSLEVEKSNKPGCYPWLDGARKRNSPKR